MKQNNEDFAKVFPLHVDGGVAFVATFGGVNNLVRMDVPQS